MDKVKRAALRKKRKEKRLSDKTVRSKREKKMQLSPLVILLKAPEHVWAPQVFTVIHEVRTKFRSKRRAV